MYTDKWENNWLTLFTANEQFKVQIVFPFSSQLPADLSARPSDVTNHPQQSTTAAQTTTRSNNNPFRDAGPSVFPRQLSKPTTPTAATSVAAMRCLVKWAAAKLLLLEQNRLLQFHRAPRRLQTLPPPSLQTPPRPPPPPCLTCRPPRHHPGGVLSRFLTTSEASWRTGRPRRRVTGTQVMMT